jgi:uncharacterized protein YndB with AHSA1/START domain
MNKPIFITAKAIIEAPVSQVWKLWTNPQDILRWNNASEDWHTTRAENDLRIGGSFLFRMEAKDGSFGFDFYGQYDDVVENQLIAYTLGDERKVSVAFQSNGSNTEVVEIFEAETTNPAEMQKTGWQAILNNFKMYVESNRQAS